VEEFRGKSDVAKLDKFVTVPTSPVTFTGSQAMESKKSARRAAKTSIQGLTPGVLHCAYPIDGFPDYFPRHTKVLLNCANQFSTIRQRPHY